MACPYAGMTIPGTRTVKATYRERWGQFAPSMRESVSLIAIKLIWHYRFHRQGM
jgi:hypothetical protein